MSDTHVTVGKTMQVLGLATSKRAGHLHQIGGFVGIIVEDILGTGVDFTTGAVKGAPLTSGVGSGRGDMFLDGVYAVPVHSGIAGDVAAGNPLYYDGTNNEVTETNSGHLAGWAWPQDGSATASPVRDITAEDPDWLYAMSPTYKVVNLRLAGFPKTGLV